MAFGNNRGGLESAKTAGRIGRSREGMGQDRTPPDLRDRMMNMRASKAAGAYDDKGISKETIGSTIGGMLGSALGPVGSAVGSGMGGYMGGMRPGQAVGQGFGSLVGSMLGPLGAIGGGMLGRYMGGNMPQGMPQGRAPQMMARRGGSDGRQQLPYRPRMAWGA